MLTGIDTSIIYQGPGLTAEMVAAEGASFHIAQLTQGAYWHRRGTRKRIREAQAAGQIAGAYHFLTRILDPDAPPDQEIEVDWNTGAAQCQFFIDHLPLDAAGARSPEGLLIAVDVENVPTTEVVHDGRSFRQDGGGPSSRIVKDFVEHWFGAFPGHPLFVYSSVGQWFRGQRDVRALDPAVYCWNADWVGRGHGRRLGRNWDDAAIAEFQEHAAVPDPFTPRWGGFGRTRIWQCAGFGIKGFGKVDGNVFDGTLDELRAFTTRGALPANPPVEVPPRSALHARAVGTVATLSGARLRAVAHLPDGARRLEVYGIQLAPRQAPGAAWPASPLWRTESGPLEPDVLDPEDPDDPDDAQDLAFLTVDDRPAKWGMDVASRSPVIRMRAHRAVASCTWKLVQNQRVLERGTVDPADIGADGRTFTIRPTKTLCAAGDPPEGYFFPPYSAERTGYWGWTYRDHSSFSVDFNRGSGATDKGDPVLAAAAGTLVSYDAATGTVTLSHWGGAYRSEYRHMRGIPRRIREYQEQVDAGQDPPKVRIGLLERVGRISDKDAEGAYHLHHVQFRKDDAAPGGYRRVRMSFGGKVFKISRAEDVLLQEPEDWTSERIMLPGWTPDVPATIRVTVAWADALAAAGGSAKQIAKLRFTVGANDDDPTDPPAAIARTHSRPGGSRYIRVARVYDGPAVAPGRYSLRYHTRDDQGGPAEAFDHEVEVTG